MTPPSSVTKAAAFFMASKANILVFLQVSCALANLCLDKGFCESSGVIFLIFLSNTIVIVFGAFSMANFIITQDPGQSYAIVNVISELVQKHYSPREVRCLIIALI